MIGVSSIDVGEVTDEALESFNRPDVIAVGVPGGGGVSTASELALFYQALLHNPDGLWDPKWLATATGDVRNTFPDPLLGVPANRSIGLVLYGDDGKGPARGFGHGQSPAHVRPRRRRRAAGMGRSRHRRLVRLPDQRARPPRPPPGAAQRRHQQPRRRVCA